MIAAIADLDPDLIADPSRRLGHTVKVFRDTASTNDLLLGLGESGTPEGLVIIADTQTAGRGQFRRVWDSQAGLGLWMSVLLRPKRPLTEWTELTLFAARSIVAVTRRLCSIECTIKPPNDVMVEERKLAGILLETRTGPHAFAVLGMGINVHHGKTDFPEPLSRSATSIALQGSPCERFRLAAEILVQLDSMYRGF